MFTVVSPTEDSRAGRFARQLSKIFGPAIKAADSTVSGALMLAFGDAMSGVYETVAGVIDEAFVSTARELLSEHEAQYGLQVRPDLSDSERQSRLVAKVRAGRAGTEQQIARSLSAISASVSVVGTTCVEADSAGNPRKTFRFTVLCADGTLDDPAKRTAIEQIVAQMKPAHAHADSADGSPFKVSNTTLGRLDRNALA